MARSSPTTLARSIRAPPDLAGRSYGLLAMSFTWGASSLESPA